MDDLTADDADDPAKTDCRECETGNHADCLWRARSTSCGCLCPWLAVDVDVHFPSLKENE